MGSERIDGALGIHVDGYVGGGEQLVVIAIQGLAFQLKGALTFGSRLRELTKRSEFWKLRYGGTRLLMGTRMIASPDYKTITLPLPDSVKKVKPSTITKERRVRPEEPGDSVETASLRTLSGARQWFAPQAMLLASASLSSAQGNLSDVRVKNRGDANRPLRFTKETEHLGLRLGKLCALPDLRRGVYFDAA